MIRKLRLTTLLILALALLAAPSALARVSGEGGNRFPMEIRNMTSENVNLMLVKTDGKVQDLPRPVSDHLWAALAH